MGSPATCHGPQKPPAPHTVAIPNSQGRRPTMRRRDKTTDEALKQKTLRRDFGRCFALSGQPIENNIFPRAALRGSRRSALPWADLLQPLRGKKTDAIPSKPRCAADFLRGPLGTRMPWYSSSGGSTGCSPRFTATECPWLARIRFPSTLMTNRCLSFSRTTRSSCGRLSFLPARVAAANRVSISTQPSSSRRIPIFSGRCRRTRLRNLLMGIRSRFNRTSANSN